MPFISSDEYSPKSLQTLWLSLLQAGIPLGIMAGYLVSGLLSRYSPQNWLISFWVQIYCLAPFALGLFFIPERYINLRARNLIEAADAVSRSVVDGDGSGGGERSRSGSRIGRPSSDDFLSRKPASSISVDIPSSLSDDPFSSSSFAAIAIAQSAPIPYPISPDGGDHGSAHAYSALASPSASSASSSSSSSAAVVGSPPPRRIQIRDDADFARMQSPSPLASPTGDGDPNHQHYHHQANPNQRRRRRLTLREQETKALLDAQRRSNADLAVASATVFGGGSGENTGDGSSEQAGGRSRSGSGAGGHPGNVGRMCCVLCTRPVFICTTFALCALFFVVSGIQFWFVSSRCFFTRFFEDFCFSKANSALMFFSSESITS